MAERYLIASGNVSDPANWFGGNKPTVGDTAHPNGFIGQIDEDITADTWTNNAGSSAVAGGSFNLLDGFTMTGNVSVGPTTVVSYSGSGEATVDGSFQFVGDGGGATHTGTGRLNITGTVPGGIRAAGARRGVIFSGGNGSTLFIGGDSVGGSNANNNQGVQITGTGTKTLIIGGDVLASDVSQALNINGTLSTLIINGHVFSKDEESAIIFSPAASFVGSMTGTIHGSVVGSAEGDGNGIADFSAWPKEIDIYGSLTARLGNAIRCSGTGDTTYRVHGGAGGGSRAGANAFHSTTSATTIDVQGDTVGGSHPSAHGILNQSTGTVRVGGESITNPSGALGISNPGGGDVTTEYLSEMEPAYLPDVKAAEGGKVLVTLLKNSVNASTLVTGTPTVEVFDFARQSVFGEPKEMTLEDGVYSYQHPTNVMTPRRLYYARVEAVIDGEAQDLIERPFVAQ